MVLPVYVYGHPVLRQVAKEVTKDQEGLADLIQNMKDTMYATDGIGIAAPQVGVSLRLIYIDVDVLKDDFPELAGRKMVLINPEITIDDSSEAVTRDEGCLSVPGISESVTRHSRIHLKYTDEQWQQHEEDIQGYLARVVQHEFDHLDGIVFTDRISPIRKSLISGKLRKMAEGKVRCRYRVKFAKPSRR